MNKTIAILVLCALATGCNQSRVVRDQSVASQFANFNKDGWRVSTTSNTQVNAAGSPQLPIGYSSRTGSLPVSTSTLFSNPHTVWSTNLKITAPASTGSTVSASGSGIIAPNSPFSGHSREPVAGLNLGGLTIQPPGSAPATIGTNGAVIPATSVTPGVSITPTNTVITPANK